MLPICQHHGNPPCYGPNLCCAPLGFGLPPNPHGGGGTMGHIELEGGAPDKWPLVLLSWHPGPLVRWIPKQLSFGAWHKAGSLGAREWLWVTLVAINKKMALSANTRKSGSICTLNFGHKIHLRICRCEPTIWYQMAHGQQQHTAPATMALALLHTTMTHTAEIAQWIAVFQWSYAETEEFFVGLIEDGLMRPPSYLFGPMRVFRPPAPVGGWWVA